MSHHITVTVELEKDKGQVKTIKEKGKWYKSMVVKYDGHVKVSYLIPANSDPAQIRRVQNLLAMHHVQLLERAKVMIMEGLDVS